MQRLDSAIARLAVWKWGGSQDAYMPWPREEVAPADGDQLLGMIKRMNLPKRKG